MDELETRLHRTWVQLLLEHNYRQEAAIAVDTEISLLHHGYDPIAIAFDLPTYAYSLVKNSETVRRVIERAMTSVAAGHLSGNNDGPVPTLPYEYRIRLIDAEDGWQNVVRSLITNSEDANQGVVTDKVFAKQGKQSLTYNEMKFGSQSEIRIAQEFELRRVLFFPLPLAVRADTGDFYRDHREVDFLVCNDGAWGILEVAYHPDRFEKDAEKDTWFKKAGILCTQHYSAERCYEDASEVVEEFLSILAKHKRT